jgi:light-regulated signal transduction histidine kinase (bacteriophytochrome)
MLENAWKYTRNTEHPRIEFGATKKNDEMMFYIKDNGAGFEMQYAHKLFEPFQRLHTSNEFEGSGIGLATVARVINRHKGCIWGESAVGEGATFYFTLP